MAQIIKHRRGSITQLKDVTARISELVVATGSIGDLNGPFLFVGETEGIAGAYRPISKIYQGATAPTITVGSHGSVIDGTPFYASGNKSLYILSKDGNSRLDFTGNIEGNTISNVTITSLTGSNANYTNLTGTTFTSTNSNITALTGSHANITNVTGTTLTSTNAFVTSLTASNAGVTNLTGSTLTSTNGTVTNLTGGTLNVTGQTFLGSDLHITGNTYQTGSIDVTGDITLGGNITIGNQTTDIIQFGGEVSSSILPIVHNSFDLGSPSKNWRNLHVSGTAYVNILEAQSISLDGITVFEDLVVSGSSYLGQGGGDQVIVSGSLYNDALTEGRIVHVGTNGQLVDNQKFTYDEVNGFSLETNGIININTSASFNLYTHDGENVYISSSNGFDVDAANDINLTSSDDVRIQAADTFVLRNTGIGEDIAFVTEYNSGNEKLMSFDANGNLTIPGGFTGSFADINTQAQLASAAVEDLTENRIVLAGVGGELEDDVNLTFDGTTLKVGEGNFEVSANTGNVRTSGSLAVIGSATLESSLTVFSTSELKGAVTINSTLDVTGSATLKDSLSVSGATSFDNNVSLVGDDTLFVNHISDYGAGNLDITTAGDIVLESTSSLSIQLKTDNSESGVNYLNVNSSSVNFSTYDITSGLTHRVLLDNTGSLRLENVDLGITGSLGIDGSLDVTNDAVIHGNLYVSGNLELLGTASYVNISASVVELGTNIINLNTYAPFERFAGLAVYDSGSNAGVTGSLLWDSTHNVWIYSHPDHMGSVASARLISGPLNTGSLGNETGLTAGHFPIASGDDHITDSLLTYLGTTLAFNTNKFTIDSGTGDTLVSGNFTLSYSGATDSGNNTSAIMFRNSANIVGFVSTTETQDVLDGILGYKHSDGALVFSTVIDGGTY